MSDLQQKDTAYIAGTYRRFPVEILSGQGSLVYDGAGRRYIDMGTGIGVNAFGVCDPTWVAAVTAQLGKVQHASNLYYTDPCVRLAELLCTRTGMAKVFFSNSGAEANEAAIKVARKYAAGKDPARQKIVTLCGSFHGRTLTTLAATGQAHYHELYQPLTPGFCHVPIGDIAALEKVLRGGDVAALLIECIQGEGGVNTLPSDFVTAAARLCQEADVLLMVDEVQTGNGRTGSLYAYMQYGITPDVVTTAKGLGGGLPLGATLLSRKVADVLTYGDHGSTFGGNPVSCAGAVCILERIDDTLLGDVRRKGERIRAAFDGAPGVRSVSGMGLMVGIETVAPAASVVSRAMAAGVLCLTAKNKVRLLPALNIPDDILEEAITILRAAIADAAKEEGETR